MEENNNNIVIYQTDDGTTKIDVKLEDETVWLSQQQMADLYDTTKQNISLHIKNIFDEEELDINSTVKEFLTVQKEGNRKVERKFKHNFWRTIRIGEKNKKNKLNHTLCIVTRYFGGIKLGAGTCGSYYEGLIKNGANFAAISVLEYILLPFLSFSFINISIWALWSRFKWWYWFFYFFIYNFL